MFSLDFLLPDPNIFFFLQIYLLASFLALKPQFGRSLKTGSASL